MRPGRARSERGAASVLVIGIVGAVVGATALMVPVAAVFVVSQRAENAADAAALAAADAISGAVPGVPCELAAMVATRNGAAMATCSIDGPVASITVAITVAGLELGATARAGPPGWSA